MSQAPLDRFAAQLPRSVQDAVHRWGATVHERRGSILSQDFARPDELRSIAGAIKQHTLENLAHYLERAEASLHEAGAKVHWAVDGAEANQLVVDIMQGRGAKRVVKSKSMVTEEIELVPFLEKHGLEAVETDLGEFIVQIDHDHPSHVVGPIVHKNRRDVARSFERIGLGAYNDDPEVITRRARAHLRGKYLAADVGLTGANFLSAESGRIVLVTNEGNSRFCLARAPIHIVVVGIEKIVPKDRDLAVFLNLLARSATGQRLSVYTEFINGPRGPTQPHGPEEMHVIFLDNRRTDVLASDCQEILRCIRCGACMNVCPVYRQASGHGYRSIYPGPLGAVLSPLLAKKFSDLADLPRASSLCGACNEVCPVDIPIPDLLLRLRDRAHREGAGGASSVNLGPWATLAKNPVAWQTALVLARAINHVPERLTPFPALETWRAQHELPAWRGGRFRNWFDTHTPVPRGYVPPTPPPAPAKPAGDDEA